MIPSTDYHDYVIKDGKLVGEFEQMYKNSSDVPWHQDKEDERLDVRLSVELLREYGPFPSICDLGCGLGYFLNVMQKEIGAAGGTAVGCDVSATACAKARSVFPGLYFLERDLMSNSFIPLPSDLVMIRGVFWYITPNLPTAVVNIEKCCPPGSILMVAQNFPPLDSQFVGKDKLPNPEALHSLFKKNFQTIKTIWLVSGDSNGNDNWFFGIFRRPV